MSSADSNNSSSPAAAAAAAPEASSPDVHPVRRQLEQNRLKNQAKRRDWESAKEASVGICGEFVGDFIRCADGKTFSVIWACRDQNNAMTQCMKKYMDVRDPAPALAVGRELQQKYLPRMLLQEQQQLQQLQQQQQQQKGN